MKIDILKLRNFRKVAGLTQKELAEKAKLVRNTYTRWETGERNPENYKDILNICLALRIKPEDICLEDIPETNAEPQSKEAQRFWKMFKLAYEKDPKAAEKAIEKAAKVFVDEV